MNIKEFVQENLGEEKLYNDDIVHLFIPLFEELTHVFDESKVANIRNLDNVLVEGNRIQINKNALSDIDDNLHKIERLNKNNTYFDISERLEVNTHVGDGLITYDSKDIVVDDSKLERPAFVLGYRSFEQVYGHYDQKTELFICGLLMASVAFDLDFTNQDDVKKFVQNRDNLYYLNPDLHPTLLLIIYQLTNLNRAKRVRETRNLVWKLKNYKDYSVDYEEDIFKNEGYQKQTDSTRNTWVLNKLKSRLFELSRRNKLLHFKTSSKFLNLTIASVPTVLYYENIKEKDLFVWNNDISNSVKQQGKLSLNKYLKLDESSYIASALDKIRSDARKDLYEYGFSQLKVVLTFLNWYNFKENKTEKISSPLLILPVVLTKKRSLTDQYVLEFTSNVAEINPVLKFQLKELYDIDLPDSIDLDKVDVNDFYHSLKQLIENRGHGIELTCLEKPKIKLIQNIAKRKISTYKKRTRYRNTEFNVSSFNYSYDKDNYKPLGLEIFRERVQPRPSFLEYLINDDIKLGNQAFSEERVRGMYTIDKDGEMNPYRWEFDMCNITLGNFNYKKMSLVRDYNTILQSPDENEVFNFLFSDDPKELNPQKGMSRFEDNFYVLPADATQARAISKAKMGKSLIIQGPPGTGKSQTITNLIADFISDGKRVLFVCEKRAALDVVYARLKSKNLHYLASLVHDSQSDKKEFIMDVKQTYEKFINDDDQFIELKTKRELNISKMKTEIEKISQYHQLLTKEFASLGTTLFSFVDLVLQQGEINGIERVDVVSKLTYADWKAAEPVLSDLSRALKSIGLDEEPSRYSLKSLTSNVLSADNPNERISQKLDNIKETTRQWMEIAESERLDELPTLSIQKLHQYAHLSSLFYNLKKVGKEDVFDDHTLEGQKLNKIILDIEWIDHEVNRIREKNVHWKSKLNKSDASSAYSQLVNLEGRFYAFIMPAYRKLKALMETSYNFSAHQVKPKMTDLLKKLMDEHEAIENRDQLIAKANATYNTDDVIQLKKDLVDAKKNHRDASKEMAQYNMAQLETYQQIQSSMGSTVHDLEDLGINVSHSSKEVQSIIADMKQQLNSLTVIIPYLQAYQKLPSEVKEQINNNTSDRLVNKKAIVDHTFKKLHNEDVKIVQASGIALKYSVDQIQKLHAELLALNGEFLLEKY